jgi:predicted GNAT family acetyltransferase
LQWSGRSQLTIALSPPYMPDNHSVSHNPAAGQFEIRTEAGTALLRYVHSGADLDLIHTEVPDALEGKGIGSALAEAALKYAGDQRMKVIPSCPFVASYIQQHPEHAALVAA